MAVFPSEAWCKEVIRLAEADPELAQASEGWKGDFCVVMLPQPPHLPEPFCIHLRPEGARIAEFRVLDDPDEAEELQPAYLARAPYDVWKGLLRGELDPVEAVLRRKVSIEGDVQPLIERARFKGIIDRVLGQISTTFVDEEGA